MFLVVKKKVRETRIALPSEANLTVVRSSSAILACIPSYVYKSNRTYSLDFSLLTDTATAYVVQSNYNA